MYVTKKERIHGKRLPRENRNVKRNKDKSFTINTVQEVCRDILIIANVKV